MIKLYGNKISNYYSLAKAVLIEKGIEFEKIEKSPSQEEDFLMKSPMGKIPAIEVDGTYLSESLAIALWADRIQPEPPLLPHGGMAAAKVMELVYHIKLDVELVAKRVLPAAFFGATVSDEVKEKSRADLEHGMKAVNLIFAGEPYAAGDTITLADFVTFYSFGPASAIVQKIYDFNLLEDSPKIRSVMEKMAGHPSIARVEAEKAKMSTDLEQAGTTTSSTIATFF